MTEETSSESNISRRAFVGTSFALLGGMNLVSQPLFGQSSAPMTVQDVISLVIKDVPNAPFEKTVDTLKAGKPGQAVTGIVTTMFATAEVIKKTAALNANFIIAHEPTFYNHFDDTSTYGSDPVFKFKRDLLEKHGIAVWRCHDYIHSFSPDGVFTGVLQLLGWEKYQDTSNPRIVNLPKATARKIIDHLKEKTGASHVRVCGSLTAECSKVLIMPGAAGGARQISMIRETRPDLVVCGELSEWETAEYMRDAVASGAKQTLVVLGHASSEEPGMKWMEEWLAPQVAPLKVTHLPSGDPFQWI